MSVVSASSQPVSSVVFSVELDLGPPKTETPIFALKTSLQVLNLINPLEKSLEHFHQKASKNLNNLREEDLTDVLKNTKNLKNYLHPLIALHDQSSPPEPGGEDASTNFPKRVETFPAAEINKLFQKVSVRDPKCEDVRTLVRFVKRLITTKWRME